ncbi:MAG: hypothetical protein L0I24_26105 [Pseudonocardia sp.]|nr:hypothetical protein [Pseudonocardia sp.]
MSRPDLRRWQFDLTWALLEYHLDRLVPEDVLLEPADLCWTLHPDGHGGWTPDWAGVGADTWPTPWPG